MNKKHLTYICYSIIFLFAMNMTITGPLISTLSNHFSVSKAETGFLFTANFIGFVSFILVGGILADILGKKLILTISLGGFGISLLLFPFALNFFTACVITVFIGGFFGVLESAVNSLVSDLNKENTSFYVNIAQVFFGIGALTGPLIIGLLISYNINWGIIYYFLGTMSLLMMFIFIFAKMPTLPTSDKIDVKSLKSIFSNTRLLLICLCMFLYAGSEVGSWGWISTFLDDVMNFPPFKASFAVGVFWVSLTIGRIICGRLILKYKTRSIVLLLSILSTIAILASGFVKSEFGIWIIIFSIGISFSSLWPLIASYGVENHNGNSGTVFSLIVGSGGLGGMVVPLLMGVIGEKADMSIAMMSPSVLTFGIVIIFLLLGHNRIKT